MATIRERGNSYQIRVSVGYNTKGEQIVRTKTWKPAEGMTERQVEKEVQKQAFAFEDECLRGLAPEAVKFEELANKWLNEQAVLSLRKNSIAKCKQLSKRVYPAIGHFRMDKLNAVIIQDFINDLALNGKSFITGKPLSEKTVIHHLTFISDIFNYAVRLKMVKENPCRFVECPKNRPKEKEIYTVDEVKQILTLLEKEPIKYRTLFTLAIFTGFRRGELLGLEWKDIDWNNCLITVKRTANYTSISGNFTDTTKTEKSKRSVKLAPEIIAMLREYKSHQDHEREIVGSKWIDEDRLFTRWNGGTMGTHTPYGWWKKFTERNGLRFCDIHSMRHFHASLLIDRGIDISSVSREMGHSTVSTTANIYCHQLELAQVKASQAMSAALLDKQ